MIRAGSKPRSPIGRLERWLDRIQQRRVHASRRNQDLDRMLTEIWARGGLPAALIVHSRADWYRVAGVRAPLVYAGLPVQLNPWAEPGSVIAVAREVVVEPAIPKPIDPASVPTPKIIDLMAALKQALAGAPPR